jgi:hypothetical protein
MFKTTMNELDECYVWMMDEWISATLVQNGTINVYVDLKERRPSVERRIWRWMGDSEREKLYL